MPSNLFIKPDGVAGYTPCSGTLGLNTRSKKSEAPLQSQLSNIEGGNPVWIAFEPASATSEQSSFAIEKHPISLRCMSAARTTLRGFSCWDLNYTGTTLPCYAANGHSKFRNRNTMYLSIGLLRLLTPFILLSEILKLFNDDYGIVFQGYFNNLMRYLPHSCVNEISFSMLHPPEGTPCPLLTLGYIALKLTPSLHELPLLMPNVLAQVQLFYDSSVTLQNCQCEATAVNVNPNNCLVTLSNLKHLFKNGNNYIVTVFLVQSELSAGPAISYMLNKAFIGSILPNRQGNSSIERGYNNNGVSTLRPSEFSRTRDVESDGYLFEFAGGFVIFPDLMDTVNENLGMEAVFAFNNSVGGVV